MFFLQSPALNPGDCFLKKNLWTADQLKKSGIRYFMGAHCTCIEPVYQIREWAGLKRGECIVGSVGATFDLAKGFTAGPLTK